MVVMKSSEEVELLQAPSNHTVISWPTIALFISIAATFLSGFIQIGTLQTHVQIDGERIKDLEDRERARVQEHLGEAISAGTVKAQQEVNGKTIDAIQLHDIQTREREGAIQERLSKVEATAAAAANAITTAASAATAAATAATAAAAAAAAAANNHGAK
jgi:hypothetical protein